MKIDGEEVEQTQLRRRRVQQGQLPDEAQGAGLAHRQGIPVGKIP